MTNTRLASVPSAIPFVPSLMKLVTPPDPGGMLTDHSSAYVSLSKARTVSNGPVNGFPPCVTKYTLPFFALGATKPLTGNVPTFVDASGLMTGPASK